MSAGMSQLALRTSTHGAGRLLTRTDGESRSAVGGLPIVLDKVSKNGMPAPGFVRAEIR